MLPEKDPLDYVYRNPVIPFIYPFSNKMSFDETLSLLHEINASQHPSKRLPVEILLYVNREIHHPNANTLWEDIRATWTPITETTGNISARRSRRDIHIVRTLVGRVRFNMDTESYYLRETPNSESYRDYSPSIRRDDVPMKQFHRLVSSADLLYRLRCYFPDIYTGLNRIWWMSVWAAMIEHNETGLILEFADCDGGVTIASFNHGLEQLEVNPIAAENFCTDIVRLLNSFFKTDDDNDWRMVFYHPAADADLPAYDERYFSVPFEAYCDPNECYFDKREDKDEEEYGDRDGEVNYTVGSVDISNRIYRRWYPTAISDEDISSSHSILRMLKYDEQVRKVNNPYSTSRLTTIVSSPLLLYRLMCKFQFRRYGYGIGNVNEMSSITSVWQVRLIHRKTGEAIVFMDNRGTFDIRAGPGVKEVMKDVEGLVELLLSPGCMHPCEIPAGHVSLPFHGS